MQHRRQACPGREAKFSQLRAPSGKWNSSSANLLPCAHHVPSHRPTPHRATPRHAMHALPHIWTLHTQDTARRAPDTESWYASMLLVSPSPAQHACSRCCFWLVVFLWRVHTHSHCRPHFHPVLGCHFHPVRAYLFQLVHVRVYPLQLHLVYTRASSRDNHATHAFLSGNVSDCVCGTSIDGWMHGSASLTGAFPNARPAIDCPA